MVSSARKTSLWYPVAYKIHNAAMAWGGNKLLNGCFPEQH